MKFFRTVIHLIVSSLKFLGRLLVHGPPIAYLIMYLFLITVFAIIFYLVRDDFYHSTVQYEPFIQNETEQILDGLKNSLVEQLKKKHPNGIVIYKERQLPGNSLRTRTWNVEGESASFVLYTHLLKPRFMTYWGVRVSFNINPVQYKHEDTQPGEELIWIPEVLITFDELASIRSEDYVPPIPLTVVFDTYKGIDGKNHMYLTISPELSEKIIAFADGMMGRPANLPGSIFRMIYFSAVTITTLGYGDIVPLTTRARVLITVEAILGIILIGFFLNSLWSKLKGSGAFLEGK